MSLNKKRIKSFQAQDFHRSSVMGEKIADMRLMIAFVVAQTLVMFLFGISALLSSSHNTAAAKDTLLQTDIIGSENEELPEGETDTDTSGL